MRPAAPRPRVDGKFLAVGDTRLWVRGATYGTFAPDEDGVRFGSREQVRRDFVAMAEHGFNVVRTYTAPPVWLLEEADRNDLYVMAGLAWEQHIAFLDERGRVAAIEARVRGPAAGSPNTRRFSALPWGTRFRHRSSARTTAVGLSVLSSTSARRCGRRRTPPGAPHVRRLPLYGVPAAAVPRLSQFGRTSTSTRQRG